MANEFENMQTAPVLTLEPFKEEETAVQVVEEKEVVVETEYYNNVIDNQTYVD